MARIADNDLRQLLTRLGSIVGLLQHSSPTIAASSTKNSASTSPTYAKPAEKEYEPR